MFSLAYNLQLIRIAANPTSGPSCLLRDREVLQHMEPFGLDEEHSECEFWWSVSGLSHHKCDMICQWFSKLELIHGLLWILWILAKKKMSGCAMPPKNLSAFIRAEMQTRFRRCVLDQAMLSVTWLLPVFQLLTAQVNVALGVGFLILFQTQVEYTFFWNVAMGCAAFGEA